MSILSRKTVIIRFVLVINFLTPDDRILFIDDFLAFGNAALGIVDLAKQSGAHIAGMGFIIEKAFQDGGNVLRNMGIHWITAR